MKTTILKNIIKEEITKLQEQQQYNSLQYMIVPSNVFGSNQNLMSQHPGFDGLSWAQNFQTTKLTQVTNPCNFLKNQRQKLIMKYPPAGGRYKAQLATKIKYITKINNFLNIYYYKKTNFIKYKFNIIKILCFYIL